MLRKSGLFGGSGILGHLCVLSLVAACDGQGGMGTVAVEQETHTADGDVVYGTDNRTDVYAHADATLRARAQQSTVALMSPGMINATNPNNVVFNAQTLKASQDLCSTQRFLTDPAAAFCSGTLIDDDLVLTAGHCVTDATDCANTRIVFNFYRTSATTLQTVTTADVFSCQSVVVQVNDQVGTGYLDYAIIRLDRPATPRFTPAPVRTSTLPLVVLQSVAVIGSGSGIPYKIDSGGIVRDPRAATLDFFNASTDTFGGNSGSGVYELLGYKVAGILVRGGNDYNQIGSCYEVNKYTEHSGPGEDITYVGPAVEAFCQVATSARLCNPNPDPEPQANPPPQPTGNGFFYSTRNTDNAKAKTINHVIPISAGQILTVGSCGVTGSSFGGDTYLRLFGPAGTEVAFNNDACGGLGSNIRYTVNTPGNYEVRAGCYSNNFCYGTVMWTLETAPPMTTGSFPFSATNTNSAQVNTTNKDVTVYAGQTLTVGTCGVAGASFTGDTYLRLFKVGGSQVAYNDDACSGSGSQIKYKATATSTFQIRAGCYSTKTCSGTVAYVIQ